MIGIIRSLLITLAVSGGFAFALKQFFGFWECFVLFTVVQFLFFFFTKNNQIQETTDIIQDLADNLDALIEKQQVNVACPCGKNTIPTVLFLDEEVILECDKCGNKFKVVVDIQTQLVTEPVNMEVVYNNLKQLKEQEKEL
jgi:hypothetical protein